VNPNSSQENTSFWHHCQIRFREKLLADPLQLKRHQMGTLQLKSPLQLRKSTAADPLQLRKVAGRHTHQTNQALKSSKLVQIES
jgi:hypothetical protein